MTRTKLAQIIALVATMFSVAGFYFYSVDSSGIGVFLIPLGFMLGLVSYVFAGLGTAIRMSAGIAKWGWFLAPFPIDIVTFLFSFIAALVVFACFPIIPVRRACKD